MDYLCSMMREEILMKMQRYCDYQDRCHQEVRSKLIRLQVYGDELEEIMAILIDEDLLNEERFARSFARGRHRIKSWGRHRISQELKKRQISDYCIRKAMEEIDEEEYMKNLEMVLRRRTAYLASDWPRGKQEEDLREHAMRKGYELSLIASAIPKVLDE
ncbi:MAG: RecX family transcriptional regulator [Saprospiraceae bacterium]|nr:RecX family transcriptional regulator [Saprospiraceae bacterium]